MPTFLGYQQRHKRNQVTIYFISDPYTDEIFYIGKTELTINQRLNSHICKARKDPEKQLSKKIIEILQKGKRPVIQTIEIVGIENWVESERFWIEKFKKNGHLLLNIQNGGGGWYG